MSDIVYKTSAINVPSILTATGTALSANTDRIGVFVQNLGTNPLFVRFGGTASSTVFHICLKAAVGADDGTGGVLTLLDGIIPTGLVSIAGTSPRFVAWEIAP